MSTWIIDGAGFRVEESGELWSRALDYLSKTEKVSLVLLNRGAAPHCSGITKSIPFPRYDIEHNGAADSQMIQKFCDYYSAELFLSTSWTTPLHTPTVFVNQIEYASLGGRAREEYRAALTGAVYVICPSEKDKNNLIKTFNFLDEKSLFVSSYSDVKAFADCISTLAKRVSEDMKLGLHKSFLFRWAQLRKIQAEVDYH